MPPEVKKIYSDMAGFVYKLKLLDSLCDELAKRDLKKMGFLNDQTILDIF
jgi:hypothetical protein